MSSLWSLASLLPRTTSAFRASQQIFNTASRLESSIKHTNLWRISSLTNKLFRTSVLATNKTVNITFIDRDGDKTIVKAAEGDTLLDVAKDNDIDLEGACEGTLACSTCHLIFNPEQYEKLGLDPPSEEELDMLDLAYGLTDSSRLGCQIEVTTEMDGVVLTVPSGTSDARK